MENNLSMPDAICLANEHNQLGYIYNMLALDKRKLNFTTIICRLDLFEVGTKGHRRAHKRCILVYFEHIANVDGLMRIL